MAFVALQIFNSLSSPEVSVLKVFESLSDAENYVSSLAEDEAEKSGEEAISIDDIGEREGLDLYVALDNELLTGFTTDLGIDRFVFVVVKVPFKKSRRTPIRRKVRFSDSESEAEAISSPQMKPSREGGRSSLKSEKDIEDRFTELMLLDIEQGRGGKYVEYKSGKSPKWIEVGSEEYLDIVKNELMRGITTPEITQEKTYSKSAIQKFQRKIEKMPASSETTTLRPRSSDESETE